MVIFSQIEERGKITEGVYLISPDDFPLCRGYAGPAGGQDTARKVEASGSRAEVMGMRPRNAVKSKWHNRTAPSHVVEY